MSAYQAPHDPTDVIAKRYGAAVIDVVIEWVVWIIAFVIAFALFSQDVIRYDYDRFGNYAPYESTELTGAGWVFLLVVGLSYMIGVFVIWRGLTGKSPGTLMLGLVTVNEHGAPLGVGRALLRSVAGVVDYIGVCSIPIVGIATSASTKGHRRVGDMAAKSFVVEKADAGQPIVVAGLTGVAGAAAGPYAQPYGAQAYGAAPYPPQPQYPGQPQAPYPAQPQYPGQPQAPYPPQPGYAAPAQPQAPYPPQPGYAAPAQPQYPAQPEYEATAPSGPGTGWPTAPSPAPEAPVTPDDGSGWGAPGATDAPPAPPGPEAEATPEPAVETPPDTPDATPPAAAPETVEPQVAAAAEPAPAPVEPAAATPGPEAAADPTQPQWDPARNAYIQWDPDGQRWMQFDDATQQWRAIS